MTVSVLDCNSRVPDGGPSFRKATGGPECELVDWFLDQDAIGVPRGCSVTVFREPRLESGFPDLVAVVWNEKTANSWCDERSALASADIRVLHYLAQQGPSTLDELSCVFDSRLASRLQRLERAETILRSQNHWRARPLTRTFAVQRIVAFEAKLSQWTSVLHQAFLNTWFASESYVLIPHLPKSATFEETALSRGLGIWTREQGEVQSPSLYPESSPRSYASWLFNEWVWRAHRT